MFSDKNDLPWYEFRWQEPPLRTRKPNGESIFDCAPHAGWPPVEIKIECSGQPCRHCATPVIRCEHKKPPLHRKGGYYFKWWLKCPKCNATYMVEAAKVHLSSTQA